MRRTRPIMDLRVSCSMCSFKMQLPSSYKEHKAQVAESRIRKGLGLPVSNLNDSFHLNHSSYSTLGNTKEP